jgi:hypothetical protein
MSTAAIDEAAARHGTDPDLLRAVLWLEGSAGYDSLGAQCVAPSIEKWASDLSLPPDYLSRPDVLLEATAWVLARISDQLDRPTVAKTATVFRDPGVRAVTDYGATVASLGRQRPWLASEYTVVNREDIEQWRDLLIIRPLTGASRYAAHDLADAHGPLNLDYYSVRVEVLPWRRDGSGRMTPQELLQDLRLSLSKYAGDIAHFEPMSEDKDRTVWKSGDPSGAIIHIDMGTGLANLLKEDGAVVVSRASKTSWTFSTVDTPWLDWEHPVSGNREFGVKQLPGGAYELYTKGADRPTGLLDAAIQNTIFREADKLWRTLMDNVRLSIAARGGQAAVGVSKQHRYVWEAVKRLMEERPASECKD